MNLTVDLNDPADLRKAEARLEQLLQVVRLALEAHGKAAAFKYSPAPAPMPPPVEYANDSAGRVRMNEALRKISFGQQFRSSDIYKAIETPPNPVPRDLSKRYFRALVRSQQLQVIEQGLGRKPTVYLKKF